MTMTTLLTSISILLVSMTAHAAPAEGNVTRFGLEAVTFQETLRLQGPTGATDQNVANYKGVLLSFEKQWRYKTGEKNGGYSIGLFYGQGRASGGSNFGSSDSYMVGGIPWSMAAVEPRMIWGWSESIDLSVGVAGTYRTVSFGNSDTVRVSTSRAMSAMLFLDVDVQLTQHLGAKQSLGLGDFDVGPMFRWGLTYDL